MNVTSKTHWTMVMMSAFRSVLFERNLSLRPRGIVAFVACGLLMMCGCGRPAKPNCPTIKLTGVVKVDGVAVEQGRIRFSPTLPDQASAAEGVIAAGNYVVENAPVGNIRVTFIGTKKTGRTVELFGQKTEESVNVIPARYSRGLCVTVDADGTRDFNLTSQ